mmetsp:Transcript_149225/g.260191  ORF Transcript_149225/g.260191 Transcript_149225/m.260191 type:complete len:237 (-) Transcript_149225:529-1239(-)
MVALRCQLCNLLALLIQRTLHRVLHLQLPLELSLELHEVFVQLCDHVVLWLQGPLHLAKSEIQHLLELLESVDLHLVGAYLQLFLTKCHLTVPSFILHVLHGPGEVVHLSVKRVFDLIRFLLLLGDALPVPLHHVEATKQTILLLLERVLNETLPLQLLLTPSLQLGDLQVVLHTLLVEHGVEAVLCKRQKVLELLNLRILLCNLPPHVLLQDESDLFQLRHRILPQHVYPFLQLL